MLLPFQPSCENMLLEIKNRLQANIPSNTSLFSLMLSETDKSYAEWCAADNDQRGG